MAPKPRSPFGDRLREVLDAKGLSQREVSRRMAEQTGRPLEQERRGITRWIGGHNRPSPLSLALLAQVLGVAVEELTPEDEDEEDAELARELLNLLRRVKTLAEKAAK